MNEYDEHTWTAEQRGMDTRIALEFEALEGSRAVDAATNEPTAAWLASARDAAKVLRAQVVRITHDGRRAHWDAELARIGLPRLPPVEEKAVEETPNPPLADAMEATELPASASHKKGGGGKHG